MVDGDIGAPQWMIDAALDVANYLNGIMNDTMVL